MKDETKFSEYFELPNPGLRAYFQHVVEGNDDEYRTPFYKGKSLKAILQEWDTQLSSIAEDWPSLYEFEKDLGNKVGPMSIMKPLSERMSDIDSYYDDIFLSSVPVDNDAIIATCREFSSIAGLRIRSEINTVNEMKKSTNSGSPYFTKRSNVLGKTIPSDVWYSNLNVYQDLPKASYKACAILGWRGQEGGPDKSDVKQRVVWMFPFAVNIQELRMYQPLIEAIQKMDDSTVPAWIGLEAVDRKITRLFDTKGKDDLVICTDFSKFDQHFNHDLQEAAKSILQYMCVKDAANATWFREVFPIKYMIPLAYDYNRIRTGLHGMASGSGGTNADETLAHRALQHEVAIRNNQTLNPNSQCLGDDGVLTYPGITVEDVVQAYSSHGQECNPDKQYASKHDCVYLRRWHHQDYRVNNVCVGVYSTNRALGRLAEQERYYDPEIWGPKMVALRQLSILENVKWHPLKEQFVDFCMAGDKFRLGLDIPGFFDNLDRIAKEATDYMPDFLGYTRSLEKDGSPSNTGISDWWIVKYLKSKA